MAYDAHREDYQRLGLRFARSLDGSDPGSASRAYAGFGRRFAQSRDTLPQSDADRAFHLVAEATTLIDYQLPFATDEEAETIIGRAHTLLDEALGLDAHCHDAARMLAAAEQPTFEAYYDYLREHAAEVKAHCEEARAAASFEAVGERAALAADIALRPYLRWLASLAAKAVICGHNRAALGYAEELVALDPRDFADVRYTAYLAYAKLEDEQGLDAFERRMDASTGARDAGNAWSRLCRASLAYRRRDFGEATRQLHGLLDSYPHAAVALARQQELPDGAFSRLVVPPFSEDELILATSEATVLLQEGADLFGRGSFGSWTMLEALAYASDEDRSELVDVIDSVTSTARSAGLGGMPGPFEGGMPL